MTYAAVEQCQRCGLEPSDGMLYLKTELNDGLWLCSECERQITKRKSFVPAVIGPRNHSFVQWDWKASGASEPSTKCEFCGEVNIVAAGLDCAARPATVRLLMERVAHVESFLEASRFRTSDLDGGDWGSFSEFKALK